jgi:hypothetical protein
MAAARLGDDLVPLGSRRISLKSWSIFSLLEKEFLSKVKLACVFGQVGNEAIVVTFDDEVCSFENNKWHTAWTVKFVYNLMLSDIFLGFKQLFFYVKISYFFILHTKKHYS